MSKTRMGIAVVVLATLLSSTALARGISPLGVARFAVGRVLSLAGHHRAGAFARHGHVRTADLGSQDARHVVDSGLANPAARRQVTAVAALAGWHGGHTANGWWRHADGGYGWVGPLFWPFAIYDIYDYTLWDDGIGFWNYGYLDIYAAIFAPYGHDDLTAYAGASRFGRRHRHLAPLQEICGEDNREIAGLLNDQVQPAMQPNNEAQRAALDDLANALNSAAQIVRASCPAQTAFTAPERLAAMQQRIGTMIKAVSAVQQPLDKFYDLLDDEQEARLNALADDRRKTSANGAAEAPAQGCGAAQPAASQWPADEIEARLHPNDTQRAALKALQDANASALDILSAACPPLEATTLPIRLDAAEGRLEAMQQAVYLVSTALEGFYATLSEAQKALFEAIGQKRTA
jgi:LTXXQ motif family protein